MLWMFRPFVDTCFGKIGIGKRITEVGFISVMQVITAGVGGHRLHMVCSL